MTKGNNYPFGSTQGGRGANSAEYRFGFNGKENDGEWGTSLVQDYGFRLYNPGIGRFLSVDPLAPDYPWYTPYQFAGNMPIWAKDLDGLEPDFSDNNFYIYKYMTGSEIENILLRRADEYDGSAISFGTTSVLTQKALKKAVYDAVDGRNRFVSFRQKWAQRNVTKYMMGDGGLDIYGIEELNQPQNRIFVALLERVDRQIVTNIESALSRNNDLEPFTIDIDSNHEQGGKMNDFSNSFGTIHMITRLHVTSVRREGGRVVGFSGYTNQTFYDVYDWGPDRRNTIVKNALGIADHWQFINLQQIGARDFHSRAYFSKIITGEINYDEDGRATATMESMPYFDEKNPTDHPEPTDEIFGLPTENEISHDGRK